MINIEKLKPDIRFFTEEEIFLELNERFPNYIFISEGVTKARISEARHKWVIWYQGSDIRLLGLLEYAKLKIGAWILGDIDGDL